MSANNPPNITSEITVFLVNVREENVYTFQVMDSNNFNVSIVNGTPSGSVLTDDGEGMYTFKWTPLDIPTKELTFLAVDELGAATSHTPLVQVCACFNGGQCTMQGVPSTGQLLQVFACICTEGKHNM